MLQYFLWYGLIGTLLGRKLLGLTRLFKPLGELGSLLFGLSGGRTVLANNRPFAHSEEFITVSACCCCCCLLYLQLDDIHFMGTCARTS